MFVQMMTLLVHYTERRSMRLLLGCLLVIAGTICTMDEQRVESELEQERGYRHSVRSCCQTLVQSAKNFVGTYSGYYLVLAYLEVLSAMNEGVRILRAQRRIEVLIDEFHRERAFWDSIEQRMHQLSTDPIARAQQLACLMENLCRHPETRIELLAQLRALSSIRHERVKQSILILYRVGLPNELIQKILVATRASRADLICAIGTLGLDDAEKTDPVAVLKNLVTRLGKFVPFELIAEYVTQNQKARKLLVAYMKSLHQTEVV